MFGSNYFGAPYYGQGSSLTFGVNTFPSVFFDIEGTYLTAIEVVGAYQTVIDVVGQNQITIDIVGDFD